MDSPLLDAFLRLVRDRPRDIALEALSETQRFHSFGDLEGRRRGWSASLEKSGIEPGSALVSRVGNRAGFFPLLLACLERRIAIAPLDESVPEVEVERVAARVGASAVVSAASFRAGGPQSGWPLRAGLGLRRRTEREPKDLRGAALIKITSGSTAEAKAVLVSEESLLADARHVMEAMGIAPHDVTFGAISLAHSYGLGNLVLPLLLQGTRLVFRSAFTPALFVADVGEAGATVFPGVPYVFEHLLRALPPGALPKSLARCVSAGAPLHMATARAFCAAHGVKIHPFYGTSETGGIAYDDSDEILDPLPVGTPLPGTEVTLRPDVEASAEGGRVFVRGAAVARGYLEAAGSDEGGFVDGGFLTGDLARRDGAGRLELLGRVSSFVNVAGLKVSPREVEQALREAPAVADARALGLPCEHRGEKLVACVVLCAPATAEDLRRFCAERLAPHKVPREIAFVSAIPVDERGKTDRRALEALARGAASD